MACSRGCCDTQREHYQSLAVANLAARAEGKTTVDQHDNHEVVVKESWGDRQDVTVRPSTIRKRVSDA